VPSASRPVQRVYRPEPKAALDKCVRVLWQKTTRTACGANKDSAPATGNLTKRIALVTVLEWLYPK
jgi:hypothetical protein